MYLDNIVLDNINKFQYHSGLLIVYEFHVYINLDNTYYTKFQYHSICVARVYTVC